MYPGGGIGELTVGVVGGMLDVSVEESLVWMELVEDLLVLFASTCDLAMRFTVLDKIWKCS